MKKTSETVFEGKAKLESLVDYTRDSILSRTLLQSDAGNITLFAFSRGQALSKHTAPFDAFISIVEGEAKITIGEDEHILKRGEAIVMPANIPHAVSAQTDFKMLLVMIKG